MRILRTTWGKIFKVSLLKKIDLFDFHQFSQRTFLEVDTIFVVSALREASRVGFLPKVLHTYFIMPASASRRYDPVGLEANVCLFHTLEKFFNQYVKGIQENVAFIVSFYLCEIAKIAKKSVFFSYDIRRKANRNEENS